MRKLYTVLSILGIAAGLVAAGAYFGPDISQRAGAQKRMDPLARSGPTIKPTGIVKSYDLVVDETEGWELVSGMDGMDPVMTKAITYNGTTPGPTIRVTEGDTLRVVVR